MLQADLIFAVNGALGGKNPYGVSRVGGDPRSPPGLIDFLKTNKLAVEAATRADYSANIALLEPGDIIAYFNVDGQQYTDWRCTSNT